MVRLVYEVLDLKKILTLLSIRGGSNKISR